MAERLDIPRTSTPPVSSPVLPHGVDGFHLETENPLPVKQISKERVRLTISFNNMTCCTAKFRQAHYL